MRNKKWMFVITIVCICLIALSIYFNPNVIRALKYGELTKAEPPVYTGAINVWQVSSWRVSQSSKTLSLLDVAKKCEKQNPHLYIEVENISYDDLMNKFAQGKYPDILSFPAEIKIDLDKCAEIPFNINLLPVHQKAFIASGNKTIPWLATANVVMINSKQATKKQYNIEKEQSSKELIKTINALTSDENYCYGSPYAMIPLALSNSKVEIIPQQLTPYRSWINFTSKESNFLYGCIWQTYSMERLLTKEKGFDIELIYPYSDMPVYYWTQNFCVFSDDENKNVMINKYIDLVLSEEWQIKLADKTASFPVTNANLNYQGVRKEIHDFSKNSTMTVVAGIGITEEEIIKALSGDPQAKLILREKTVIN